MPTKYTATTRRPAGRARKPGAGATTRRPGGAARANPHAPGQGKKKKKRSAAGLKARRARIAAGKSVRMGKRGHK